MAKEEPHLHFRGLGHVWLFVMNTGLVDGFRATISTLRSLDGSKGVRFHTFSLMEDHCLGLLGKTLGRQMPEEVVREELETMGMCPGSLAAPFRAP